ncbi:MAG TPA: TVP38/TMEM64 family protein [Usitatibacter sp.]|nr:TVP38/TMEM64 family protein [Usitatibacter sp.]
MTRRISLAALALVALAVSGWWVASFGLVDTVQAAEERIRSWGAWGVAGSIALMVVHSFLPFPSEIIALANGMVYGPLWGAVITWIGAMLGASAAFALARAFGRPLVMRWLSPRGRQALEHWSLHQAGPALLAARLVPVIAFNLVNYAAGLTHVSWRTFLWATGLGILPLTILLAVLGENVLDMPAWSWLVIAAAAVLAWLALRHWRRTRAGS